MGRSGAQFHVERKEHESWYETFLALTELYSYTASTELNDEHELKIFEEANASAWNSS
jgi:hypothetical protein